MINPFKTKKGLGRGLSSLIGDSDIKERGIIQPIILRKSENIIDKFEIVAGERRWQAAQKAGLHKVPVAVSYTHLTLPTILLV